MKTTMKKTETNQGRRGNLSAERIELIARKDAIARNAFSKPTMVQFNQVMKQHKKVREDVDRLNEYFGFSGDKIIDNQEKEATRTE